MFNFPEIPKASIWGTDNVHEVILGGRVVRDPTLANNVVLLPTNTDSSSLANVQVTAARDERFTIVTCPGVVLTRAVLHTNLRLA